jgi:hypothetical protein
MEPDISTLHKPDILILRRHILSLVDFAANMLYDGVCCNSAISDTVTVQGCCHDTSAAPTKNLPSFSENPPTIGALESLGIHLDSEGFVCLEPNLRNICARW